MQSLTNFLFKRIDNSQLVVFRVFYGLLVCAESFGAIATGWVRRTLVEPSFTFSFIGFEWLQPLPGNGMYFYFVLMGICGILITIGLKYRSAALGFAFLWAGVYLMQKTSYNNHYYLFMLLAFIMALMPANRDISLDAKLNPGLKRNWMHNWIRWFIILKLFIVYTYASIAKLYNDWFDLSIIEILMKGRKDYFLIGEVLQERWAHQFIAGFGILFDLLIVPALLWKPTRKIAFGFAIFFHLFNSYVFRIGIFPYLALALCVFFFPPENIRRFFLRKKPEVEIEQGPKPKYHGLMITGAAIYLFVQLILPIRHHFIKGDVLWTEEGHRLSWRMMLRTRSGFTRFIAVDKETKDTIRVKLKDHLTKKQRSRVHCYPDFMWQFAQYLREDFKEKGRDVSIFVKSKVKVNKGERMTMIDPEVDLARAEWDHFAHNEWILLQDVGKKKKTKESE